LPWSWSCAPRPIPNGPGLPTPPRRRRVLSGRQPQSHRGVPHRPRALLPRRRRGHLLADTQVKVELSARSRTSIVQLRPILSAAADGSWMSPPPSPGSRRDGRPTGQGVWTSSAADRGWYPSPEPRVNTRARERRTMCHAGLRTAAPTGRASLNISPFPVTRPSTRAAMPPPFQQDGLCTFRRPRPSITPATHCPHEGVASVSLDRAEPLQPIICNPYDVPRAAVAVVPA
jgi:hypothetical protein